jgi:hypothetical protein
MAMIGNNVRAASEADCLAVLRGDVNQSRGITMIPRILITLILPPAR